MGKNQRYVSDKFWFNNDTNIGHKSKSITVRVHIHMHFFLSFSLFLTSLSHTCTHTYTQFLLVHIQNIDQNPTTISQINKTLMCLEKIFSLLSLFSFNFVYKGNTFFFQSYVKVTPRCFIIFYLVSITFPPIFICCESHWGPEWQSFGNAWVFTYQIWIYLVFHFIK